MNERRVFELRNTDKANATALPACKELLSGTPELLALRSNEIYHKLLKPKEHSLTLRPLLTLMLLSFANSVCRLSKRPRALFNEYPLLNANTRSDILGTRNARGKPRCFVSLIEYFSRTKIYGIFNAGLRDALSGSLPFFKRNSS